MGIRSTLYFFLCAVLVVASLHNHTTPYANAEDIPGEQRTINMEIILDSSGSMAAATSTGELRYVAAQSVLHNVINALPEEPGVNVGLRVFGQDGDNTEAGYAQSCGSTDLLVPVSGVDKPALTQAVDAFYPVGWTPMSLALDAAGEDFTDSDATSATNVVVLVTDGLETCGGDPVASATALRNSPENIITYVIGFGTTAEEQQTLNGVAQAGGGQLFGAANAHELNSAIFDILEELEIVVGAGFIGGNAFGLLGSAPIGTVDVVSYSWGQYGSLPIVVHNNLGQDISSVNVTIIIRGSDGSLIATGDSSRNISPRYLRAGGYAIGDIYLGADISIPADANVEFSVNYGPATLIDPFARLDFDIVEAGIFEDRIVGSFENSHVVGGEHGVRVQAVCFDGAGTAVSLEQDFMNNQAVAPGDVLPFQINRLGYLNGLPCEAFLVTASASSPGAIPVQPGPTAVPSDDTTTIANASPVAESENEPLATGEPPYPLPVQDPRLGQTYSNPEGVQNAAARHFVASNDPGLWIAIAVATFDTEDNAQAGMVLFQERYNANVVAGQFPMFGEVVDIPVPEGFDAAIATFYTVDGTYPAQYASMITATRGTEVYSFEISGYSPSYDMRVVDLMETAVLHPVDRGEGTAELPTWGIWGLLPIESELPVGYVLSPENANYVPRNFGPIPPN